MFRNTTIYIARRHYHQMRETLCFLENFVLKMDWSRQDMDVVMDVGCIPEGICDNFCLSAFPGLRKMICLDTMESMVEIARENNSDERVEFHLANIEKKQTVEQWFHQITKLISTFYFHWVKSVEGGLSNIYNLLTHGGEAALIFVGSSALWDSYGLIYSYPKWNKYIKDVYPYVPESHFKKYGLGYFCNLFEKIGFRVILAEHQERTCVFQDDNDCREFWFLVCGFSKHIPDELKEDFKNDLLEVALKCTERNSKGKLFLNYSTVEVLLKKPTE